MAPSAAERWFIPDQAYSAANEDYAVIGRTTQNIKQETLAHDFQSRYFSGFVSRFGPPRSFSRVYDLIRNHYHGYVFATMQTNALIYADVDQSNPDHEKEIRAKVAAAQELETATEQNEAVKATIIKKLLDIWNEAPAPGPDAAGSEVERVSFTEEKAAAFLDNNVGDLPSSIFEVIASLGEEERKEALIFMSGQAKIPVEAQRPVLVLVNIIDTAQSATIGVSRGYRTAYDPITKELITRPFTSDEQTHPLGDSWYADLPEDGISFRGSYQDFVTKFLTFMKDVNEDRIQPGEQEGFKFLVWASTMDFIAGQSYCFVDDHDALFTNEDLKLKGWDESYKEFLKMEMRFRKVQFPNVERKEQEKYQGDDLLDLGVISFKDRVGELEDYMRVAAVDVKGKGKEGKAEEAAKLWDRVAEAIAEYEKAVEGM